MERIKMVHTAIIAVILIIIMLFLGSSKEEGHTQVADKKAHEKVVNTKNKLLHSVEEKSPTIKVEAEHLAAEKLAKEKLAKEKLAKEKAEKENAEAKAKEEAAKKAEAEHLAKEKLAKEKAEKESAEAKAKEEAAKEEATKKAEIIEIVVPKAIEVVTKLKKTTIAVPQTNIVDNNINTTMVEKTISLPTIPTVPNVPVVSTSIAPIALTSSTRSDESSQKELRLKNQLDEVKRLASIGEIQARAYESNTRSKIQSLTSDFRNSENEKSRLEADLNQHISHEKELESQLLKVKEMATIGEKQARAYESNTKKKVTSLEANLTKQIEGKKLLELDLEKNTKHAQELEAQLLKVKEMATIGEKQARAYEANTKKKVTNLEANLTKQIEEKKLLELDLAKYIGHEKVLEENLASHIKQEAVLAEKIATFPNKIDELVSIAAEISKKAEAEFVTLVSQKTTLENNLSRKLNSEMELKSYTTDLENQIEKLKIEKEEAAKKIEEARLAEEKLANEKAEQEAAEAKAKEEAEAAKKAEEARLEAERLAEEKLAKEKAEKEAAEAKAKEEAEVAKKAEEARVEAERLVEEKLAKEKAEKEAESTLMNAFSLTKVAFQTGSTRLTSASKKRLDSAINTIKKYEGYAYKINGHTDSRGKESFNLSLSTKRAEAVKAYLVSKGIDTSILSAQGFGSSQPISSNDSKKGREENRRVVFEIIK